jgi:hypothetical protein
MGGPALQAGLPVPIPLISQRPWLQVTCSSQNDIGLAPNSQVSPSRVQGLPPVGGLAGQGELPPPLPLAPELLPLPPPELEAAPPLLPELELAPPLLLELEPTPLPPLELDPPPPSSPPSAPLKATPPHPSRLTSTST